MILPSPPALEPARMVQMQFWMEISPLHPVLTTAGQTNPSASARMEPYSEVVEVKEDVVEAVVETVEVVAETVEAAEVVVAEAKHILDPNT